MPKSKKKVQEPAYVVTSSSKEKTNAEPAEQSQPSMKSLMGETANMAFPKNEEQRAPKKSTSGSFGRQPARGRHMRPKPSAGPTRSLMAIDFSSMERKSSGENTEFRGQNVPVPQSADEESNSDRRGNWKNGCRKPIQMESLMQRHDVPSVDNGSWWRQSHPQQAAAVIVDMAHRPSMDAPNKNQPKSLLGDYWTVTAQKPASLMDFMPNTRMGQQHTMPSEPFDRRNEYIPPPNFNSNMARNMRTGNNKVEQSTRKRSHGPTTNPEVSEKKACKNEHKQKPHLEVSNKLIEFKGSGHSFVLIPASCSTTYIHGRAKVTVLKGDVTILAHKLKERVQYDVFSPTSGSLLALNCADGQKLPAMEVKEALSKYNIPGKDKELENVGNSTVAIIMLDKLDSTTCDYITSFIPYTQLFTAPMTREKDAHSVRGITLPKLGVKIAPLKEMGPLCLNMSQDYEDVLEKFTTQVSQGAPKDKHPPIWLCCGAKNSGKSTFCRMLINTALKSVDSVGYLECDVGQTEFSPPATLSFHVIKKPILGQPFCHQRHAERMVFYGEVASGYDPSLYMDCLQRAYEAYKEMEKKPPLIVNTMGFPEGIGLMLMIDTVQLVRPDMVVQIESNNQAINFPAITHELVALDEGWSCNKAPVTDPKSKMEETHAHELILLPTLLNHRRDFSLKFKPIDLRNLSLLASLSLGLEAGLTLTSMPPFAVPFRQLAIHVCHHRLSSRDVLAAVDASVVALCHADVSQTHREEDNMPLLFDKTPVCDCLGLAIIRGVDMNQGLLYIVSTLPRVSLTRVNTVLKGCISLPDQIILKQKSVGTEPLPYVDALAPSTGVTAVRQRARMPRKTLGGNDT